MRNSYFLIIVCIAVFVLTQTAGAQTCATPPSGIISWWPFDDTGGATTADIVGNHTGYLVNGPIPTSGLVDGALRFNGSTSYVTVDDSDLWAFGARDFTIEFWANFSSLPGSVYTAVFIGNDEGPSIRNKWFFTLALGNLQFHINGPTVGSQSFPWVPFSPVIGQWYHLAVTRNGSTYTIYINGLTAGSAINTNIIPDPNAPLTIGQAEGLGYMPGLLDEITIYDRALSQSELHAIVAAGQAGKCKQSQVSSYAFFPQVAVGGGYSTLFTVTNTGSTTASGSLNLKDPQGNPFPVNGTLTDSSGVIQPASLGDSFPITVPAGGTIFLYTTLPANDSIRAGWGRLAGPEGSLTGVATYEYEVGSILQTMVGVLETQPLQYATIPVDIDSDQGKQTAFAIANPGNQTVVVKLALVAQDGTISDDTVSITLGPGEQIARYLWQELSVTKFKGSLVLRGQNGATFVALALLDKQGVLTAIPLISGKAPNIPN